MVRIEDFRGNLEKSISRLGDKSRGLTGPERVAMAASPALQEVGIRARFDNGPEGNDRTTETVKEVERRIDLIERSPAWLRAQIKVQEES